MSRTLSALEQEQIRRKTRANWLLSTPALLLLLFAASGPLIIVVIYSFLSSGNYGGVVWEFSTDAWFNVLYTKDILMTRYRYQMLIFPFSGDRYNCRF